MLEGKTDMQEGEIGKWSRYAEKWNKYNIFKNMLDKPFTLCILIFYLIIWQAWIFKDIYSVFYLDIIILRKLCTLTLNFLWFLKLFYKLYINQNALWIIVTYMTDNETCLLHFICFMEDQINLILYRLAKHCII